MKNPKIVSKKSLCIVTLLLALTMILPMATLPAATAHTPSWNIPTYAYLETPMNPVGVGQTAYVYMWLDKTISGALMNGNNIRFHGFELTVTAPDGTVTKKTWDVIEDTTSSQSYVFTPDQVGTYTFEFNFPGQTYTWNSTNTPGLAATSSAYYGDYYMPSTATCTLTVTEEGIVSTEGGTAMPTEYWTRPIFGENDQWYSVSSNWLGSPGASQVNQGYGSCYPGDAIGSKTSHVMWTKSIQDGGVVGGEQSSTINGATFFEGTAYLGRFKNPIILSGKLYYTEPVSFSGAVTGATVCVDLRTGQEYWRKTDIPALSHGIVYDVQNPNQHGAFNPLIVARTGTTWIVYDAYTGNFMFNATNVPTGTSEVGPNGEYLIYQLTNKGTTTNPDWYLARWNSTKLWTWGNTPSIASTVDASTSARYDFNVSVSYNGITADASTVLIGYDDEFAICRTGAPARFGSTVIPWTYFRVNIANLDTTSTSASVTWSKTINPPDGNLTIAYSGADYSTGVFVEKYKETMKYIGYSMDTGAQLWTTDGNEDALNYYSSGYNAGGNQAGAAYAYGKLYVSGMSGILYCYDLTDGSRLWTFGNGGEGNSTYSGLQVPGHYPITTYAIGDGVVYLSVTEHTVTTPIYKASMFWAVNATDGSQVWELRGVRGEAQSPPTGAIADGFNIFMNGYDNLIYSVGRGPSQTTVSAPSLSVTSGSTVLIQGTVTDIASGTTQNEQAARFPAGVPVASDECMTEWMAYVYQQAAKPTDFTGVEVTISVIDGNGNYRTIGTAATDSSGFYSFTWTPDIEGKFTVYATFCGTNAYWGSTATTAFNVDPAAATPTPMPTAAPSMADMYFLPAIIGVIVAIIVVGAVLALLVTKKP